MALLDSIIGWGMKREAKKWGSANLRLGTCVWHFLNRKYKTAYGGYVSPFLATVVTNELYDTPTPNPEINRFLVSNRDLVDTELAKIRDEPRICCAVSIYAHMKANLSRETGMMTSEIVSWLQKLERLGILLPIEKVQMPGSLDEFNRQITDFEREFEASKNA